MVNLAKTAANKDFPGMTRCEMMKLKPTLLLHEPVTKSLLFEDANTYPLKKIAEFIIIPPND